MFMLFYYYRYCPRYIHWQLNQEMGDFPYLEWLTRQYKKRAGESGQWRQCLQVGLSLDICVVLLGCNHSSI